MTIRKSAARRREEVVKMGVLNMKEKRKVVEASAKRYRRGRKKEKKKVLDEIIELTNYNRVYASYLMRNWGKKISLWKDGHHLIIILGQKRKRIKMEREKVYNKDIFKILKKLWAISGYLCGKRLTVYIKQTLPVLEKYGEVKLNRNQKEKLLNISAATIDRLLSKEKKEILRKKRSWTRPGSLLKHQIPIRTYSEWNEKKPGYAEIDLVSHSGEDASGEFIQSLNFVDICTGWVEPQAVLNKAQKWVFEALTDIRKKLPFDLLGIDSDNGSEVINKPLYIYCRDEGITFTRSRPLRKNDNCYVEQKNYTVVRKTVGYQRFEGEKELKVMNEIYKRLRLIINFFTPSMKLLSKERIGSRVIKKYDRPKTPLQRVLESPYVTGESKKYLKAHHLKLNPVQLKREMLNLLEKLWNMASKRKKSKPNFTHPYYDSRLPFDKNFVYNFK